MKVALVYDRVNKWGGAERVLLALKSLFPDAPLYTSVYNPDNAKWADVFKVRSSFLQKFPFAKKLHEYYAPLMPMAFESFDFSEFDAVISVTSEAAKGIITKPETFHLCVCLTPTRYLWSGHDEYFKNPVLRFVSWPMVRYLQMWDKIAAQRPDQIVSISKTVSDRVQKYYNRSSEVIYPPMTLHEGSSVELQDRDYFLVVSRLSKMTAYKRVDLAIKAANKLKLPLKIIGTGRDLNYYQKMAGPTVGFIGRVTDEELSAYYKNAAALIFPGNEDFGLVMVEAQMHGKPVIAYRAGGATEIVQEGKTGEFFDKQTVASLCEKLALFDKSRYNTNDSVKNARRFSEETFAHEFLAFFNQQFTEYQKKL